MVNKMEQLHIKTRDGADISLLYFASDKKNAPLIFDIHGDGYVSGKAKDEVAMCHSLVEKCGVNVASVDYRYAPKVKYPQATDDCKDALRYLIDNRDLDFDRDKIFLLGHSAGGNAVVAVSAEMGNLIAGQILDYPWLDVRLQRRKPYIMYSITSSELNRLSRLYFRDEDREKHDASAVLMTVEEAKKLPRTFITTCGRDTLKRDGEAFLKILTEAGIPVRHKEYTDAIHGFVEICYSGRIKSQFWLGSYLIAKQEAMAKDFVEEINKFIVDV